MYILALKTMSRKHYIIISIRYLLIFLIDPCYSVNKIPVSGVVKNIKDNILQEAQLTLIRQKKCNYESIWRVRFWKSLF